MNKVKKPYVKPEITVIPCDSPSYEALLQPLERQSRGQRFDSVEEPDTPPAGKT